MMMGLRASVGALVALLGFLPALSSAQNSTAPVAASTFYLARTETQFSINIANNSDDVFIYYASPAYSWVGVGFGSTMDKSLMFIMYPNDNGDNVTISPRIGQKASEPIYTPDVKIETLSGTKVNDSMLILRARCSNCRKFISSTSGSQPMIYAFGPGNGLYSNSRSANLKRHVRYGHFTMDFTAATGAGDVPAQSSELSGVQLQGDMTKDHDRKNHAHAIIGCLALFFLWPVNVFFAGFFKNIKIHFGITGVMFAFLVTSYALGIATSSQYNRSKTYATPHQIVAFICLLPTLALAILPTPAISARLPTLRTYHTPLASLTFVLLVLTGGLGLHLGMQMRPVILVYTAVALGAFAFITIMQTCIRKRGSAHARAKRVHEEDREIMMHKMQGSRNNSDADSYPPQYAQSQGHQRTASKNGGIYGGGAMPGPQYLLNMHPGVPVQVNRM